MKSRGMLALAGTVVIGLGASAPNAIAADEGNAFEANVAAYKAAIRSSRTPVRAPRRAAPTRAAPSTTPPRPTAPRSAARG